MGGRHDDTYTRYGRDYKRGKRAREPSENLRDGQSLCVPAPKALLDFGLGWFLRWHEDWRVRSAMES